MNNCKRCGAELTEEAKFCSECGARIETENPAPAPEKAAEGAKKPIYKKWWFWVIVVIALLLMVPSNNEETPDKPSTEEQGEATKRLEFLNDFTEYGYSAKQIEDMRTVLLNVGITEITELEIGNVVSGMQVVKGLAYKDTSFMADANDEVQVTFNIENGVIYLVAIYCPSYYSANKPTYLSGLTNRRADLYYDVEGGYLKKIDWKNKTVVDYN